MKSNYLGSDVGLVSPVEHRTILCLDRRLNSLPLLMAVGIAQCFRVSDSICCAMAMKFLQWS